MARLPGTPRPLLSRRNIEQLQRRIEWLRPVDRPAPKYGLDSPEARRAREEQMRARDAAEIAEYYARVADTQDQLSREWEAAGRPDFHSWMRQRAVNSDDPAESYYARLQEAREQIQRDAQLTDAELSASIQEEEDALNAREAAQGFTDDENDTL